MKDEFRKEILGDLTKVIQILEQREKKDIEELRILSDHAIEDVAVYKDLDLISITVLIYSIYKILARISEQEYKQLFSEMKFAKINLQHGDLGKYNKNIKTLYKIISRANALVKEHLDDVMQAARIKKGTILLSKGLSIGQAAGLMGLTNWDLQQYAGKTTAMEPDLFNRKLVVPIKKRVQIAMKIFGVN